MPATILLVDDDDGFKLIVEAALRKLALPVKLLYVNNGSAAVQYLSGQRRHADDETIPFPSLVLLDLKMPGMSGFDVLEWKRNQPCLRSLPVAIWSSSDLPEDKQRSLALGAIAFYSKPMEIREYMAILKELEIYWKNPADVTSHTAAR
jgi:CheY-like chemotaxis protein